MQLFFARGQDRTNFESSKPLYVNNCGFYKDLESDIWVNRPSGRNDFHLLVPSSGMMTVGMQDILPNKVYLFFPSSPQHYCYHRGEGTEYYWLHFSGKSVTDMLELYGVKEGVCDLGGVRVEAERIIRMMLRALSEKYKFGDEFCEGLLRSLFALIASPPSISSPFLRAIRQLSDPADNCSVEELAENYGMSANHFIRSFKQYVGMSPNAFRISKRIELACEMLASTDLSVESVAVSAGYPDPLYFSRAFKKSTGFSPSEYRKRNKSTL